MKHWILLSFATLVLSSPLSARVIIGPNSAATTHQNEARGSAEANGHQANGEERHGTGTQHLSPHPGFRATPDGLPIFGSQLFQGDFGDLSFSGFNPAYQIGVGDEVQVLIWGSLEAELDLTVDARGNLFIPRIGPVNVLGVRNEDLNHVLSSRIRNVYTDNVESYANLRSTQSAKVFVSGFVNKPGLYEGFASDSALFFLDRAGGIDLMRGSYLKIRVLRENETLATINLYDFLQHGTLPPTHFRDGDVILVENRGPTITITGQVQNPGRFEFPDKGETTLESLLALAAPDPEATNVSIRRARAGQSEAILRSLPDSRSFTLQAGDRITVGGRSIQQNILVTYTGEHLGEAQLVFPRGATLADAFAAIEMSPLSNMQALQLFRESVATRQADLLNQSLDNLERSVLTASSNSLEEAQLRQLEAETILSFIDRARGIRPTGQILIEDIEEVGHLHLEDGDIIFVPALSSLVTIHGEVKYPNTQTHRANESIMAYINRAGGLTDNANDEELILIRANGLIETVKFGRRMRAELEPGDEIIVLPQPDTKRLLFVKEITTILYQIALSARVAIGL